MGFGIDDLKNAGVVANAPVQSAPQTQTQKPASTGGTTGTQSTGDDEYVDSTGLQDDTSGPSQAEIEAQQNKEQYEAAAQKLQAAASAFGVKNSTSGEYDDIESQISALSELGNLPGVTPDTTADEAKGVLEEADATIAMEKDQYNNFCQQLSALSDSSLAQDPESFAELLDNFNSSKQEIKDSEGNVNSDLADNVGNYVYLTEAEYTQIQEAVGATMEQTMANSVNQVYESNDYKILTGEVPATEEEKQQARANFEQQKANLSSAGTMFSELGLTLPENCQITEVVDWGSQAKEGDAVANDCMDRIIQNYLSKNNLEGYLTPSEAYDMIMQLNPDIYSDINSGQTIYAGQQFLMPDASAIRGMDGVKEQILTEAINADETLNGQISELGDNADVNYNAKNNQITVVDKETGALTTYDVKFNSDTGAYEVDKDSEATTYDKETVDSSMQNALSKMGITDATAVDGTYSTGSTSGNGNVESVYETEEGDKIKVSYDPETGKTVMNYITSDEKDEDGNYTDLAGDVTFDENENTLTFIQEEDGSSYQFVNYLDDEGNVTKSDKYNTNGTIASTTTYNSDGEEETSEYTYSSNGSLASIKVGDKEYSVEDLQSENEDLTNYQAQDVLKQIANGTSKETALENVQSGKYSTDTEDKGDAADKDTDGDTTGTVNAEASKESIVANLDENAPDDIEFEQQEDGTYTAEYTTNLSNHHGALITKSVVTYDPESGITTIKDYNVSDTEGNEIEEGQEPSSVKEYNENTNTETFTSTLTRHETGKEPETINQKHTIVYSDDSMSKEAATRVYVEEIDEQGNEKLSSVTTKQDGEITGYYAVEYEGDAISEFTVKDANGTQQTFSVADLEGLKDANGNQITSSQIKDIMTDIQNGESPKTAFKNNGGDELLNYIAENNIQLGTKGTRNDTEDMTYAVDEAAALCLPQFADSLELSGNVEEKDGVYVMTYEGSIPVSAEENENVTYQVEYNPETGVTTFSALDEEGNPTEETHSYDSKNLVSKSKNADGSVEISKYSYGENEEGELEEYADTMHVAYDDNDKISKVTVKDTKGTSVTIDGDVLKDLDLTQTEIDEIFNELTSGESSPRSILEDHLTAEALGSLELSENNNEASNEALNNFWGTDNNTMNIENFEEEFNKHLEDGTLHDYLINNVTSDNIMDIVSTLGTGEEDSFDIMNAIWDATYMDQEEMDKCAELLSNVISGVDVDELKENGQYEAYVNFVANEINNDLANDASDVSMTSSFANNIITGSLDESTIIDIVSAASGSVSNGCLSDEAKAEIENIAIKYMVSDEVSNLDGTNLASKAQDLLIERFKDGTEADIIQRIVDKDNEEYNAALVDLAQKYSEQNDNASLMRQIESDRDLCMAYANRLISQFAPSGENNDKLAKILANDLYQAMEGAGSRTNMLDAILGNKDNDRSRISKDYIMLIEDAFNNANYKNTKLWQYIDSQWSIGADRQKEYKQHLDEDWSNE